MHVTLHERFRLISACAVATVLLTGLTAPGSAFAQASRMGGNIEVIPPSSNSRFPAVAYDSASDSYLVVSGIVKVSARFISAAGVPLGPDDSLNPAGAGAPGVACSVAAGACLVAWVQEPSTIMGRLIRNTAGEVDPVTAAFPINAVGLKGNASAPGVAASASGEFLVAWQTAPGADILAQRVTPAGSLAGPTIVVAQTAGHDEMLPTLAYNSAQDEYMVGYYFEPPSKTNSVILQRVKPGTGALLTRSTLYSSVFAQYPEIAYNSTDNQFLAITWGGLVITGGLADGNGEPLTSGAPGDSRQRYRRRHRARVQPGQQHLPGGVPEHQQRGGMGRRGEQDRSPRRRSSS